MNTLKKIKKEINKVVKIKGHILYNQYADIPLLKDCNSDWLKENFKDYLNTPNFIAGLYNSLKYFNKNISVDKIIEYFKRAENSLKFDISYYIPGQKYYAVKEKINSIFDNIIVQIKNIEDIEDPADNAISIYFLNIYKKDFPNMLVMDGIFNESDKQTTKFLLKKKLMIKPIREEKRMFML